MKRLFGLWKKRTPELETAPGKSGGKGFLTFHNTGEVLRAERLLREAGLPVEVKGPPPELRTGCDMVIVFELLLEPAARRVLQREHLEPLSAVPVDDPLLEPVSLFHTTDYGRWFMVRAANMKITVEKDTGTIVNVSGGGCPDVPWLAARLNGRRVSEAEEPCIRGQTLCAYALHKAFVEARRLWREGA
ncbi:DUF3343 domain-containing protein [uncultured Mailhella sp.]|uniref:DUF3343 domain-containing protein n=1 Tax=uncultured Mailhella sp. TaxID=1981031 RepID=UPI0026161F7D|nr:DUF3343 domain-containing protein [uncultured Mailhella sp.]